ncbi:mechanosensitive ion channel family protein [Photobacterium damselae]|uniref:mechanosensitive ion channel family protein n=1 Tax=Photobacterium damselae TaxID=38293 RepID=UPI001F1ADEDC|nr:mechanosensitive ion channel domain-containing protein [Photobacterium damselae]UKA04663.1 mechanosensitive ion channel family protein [Photobacterium damselae subsp. damselae]
MAFLHFCVVYVNQKDDHLNKMNHTFENMTIITFLLVVIMVFAGGFLGYTKDKDKEIKHSSKNRELLFKVVVKTWRPMLLFLSTIFVYIWARVAIEHFRVLGVFAGVGKNVCSIIVLTALVYLLYRISGAAKEIFTQRIGAKEEIFGQSSDINSQKTKIIAVSNAFNILLFMCYSVTVLDKFGISTGSLLAFGGFGSIVLGFAARDILSDFVSAILLFVDGQFSCGDWIKLENPKVEGTVESIGWRVCKIKTFDNRPLYVPNSLLGKAIILNVTRRDAMRIKEYISIDPKHVANISAICKEIKNDIIRTPDGIDPERNVVVNVTSYKAGCCWIYISAHTRITDTIHFYGIKQALLLRVVSTLKAHGIEIVKPLYDPRIVKK